MLGGWLGLEGGMYILEKFIKFLSVPFTYTWATSYGNGQKVVFSVAFG